MHNQANNNTLPNILNPNVRRGSEDPAVKLESSQLWEEFHHIGTEMVITKSGRWVVVVVMVMVIIRGLLLGKCSLR